MIEKLAPFENSRQAEIKQPKRRGNLGQRLNELLGLILSKATRYIACRVC